MKRVLGFVFFGIIIPILIMAFPLFLTKEEVKTEEMQVQQIEEFNESTDSNNYNSKNTLNYINVLWNVGYMIIVILSGIFWFLMVLFIVAVGVIASFYDSKYQSN